MRECPEWFQSELARIGGVNQYDEPIFRLVWSQEPRMTVSGNDGYRSVPQMAGTPCWALLVWEPCELLGTYEAWESGHRNEYGLLDIGGYPKHGCYRLLQKFIHREMIRQHKEHHWLTKDGKIRTEITSKPEFFTYRLEPCGFILDIMLPMLVRWRRLTNAAKVEVLRAEEQAKKDEVAALAKDLRSSIKVSKGSPMVQKRAELIEAGLPKAMEIATHMGLGMRVMN